MLPYRLHRQRERDRQTDVLTSLCTVAGGMEFAATPSKRNHAQSEMDNVEDLTVVTDQPEAVMLEEDDRSNDAKRARIEPQQQQPATMVSSAGRSRAGSDVSVISVSSGTSGFANLVPLRHRSGSDMSSSGGAAASIHSLAQTLSSSAMGLIPLRQRNGSDIARAAMSSLSERAQRDNWRRRLWPAKAQINFIRAITRCCPETSAKPHDKLAHGSFLLGPSWDQASLPAVPPTFKSMGELALHTPQYLKYHTS